MTKFQKRAWPQHCLGQMDQAVVVDLVVADPAVVVDMAVGIKNE